MTLLWKYCAIALATGVSCACVPLAQAPLVYSSAEKGGINVAASPSAASVVEVNIGYSLVDAAYVPVEVSKPCEKFMDTCPTSGYDLVDVRGAHTVTAPNPKSEAEIAGLMDTLKKKIEAEQNAQTATTQAMDKQTANKKLTDAQNTAEKQVTAAQSQQAAAADALKNDSTNTDLIQKKDAADKAVIVAQTNAANARTAAGQVDISADAKAVTSAQDALVAAKAATVLATASLSDAYGQKGDNFGKDALSVFGTFNQRARGDKDGAELSLGKMFSTGIAAQNVSTGVKAGFVADCLRNAVTFANNDLDNKKTLLATALIACMRE